MTDCEHLLHQRIKTSEQNAAFAQSNSNRRRVEIGLHLRVKVDETYYCDLLLSQQLLPPIRHVSSEFIF